MSLTYLQAVNKLASEAGVSGTASTVSTVAGQSGDSLRLCNWIAEAYTEIQNRYPNWRWLRSRFSLPTVAGTDTYAYTAATDTRLSAAISRFKAWVPFDDQGAINVSRYLTSGGVSGQMWMTYLPWSMFRAMYKFGPQQSNTGPIVHITIDPQNKLVMGPNPDAIYTVIGEYQMSAQVLAADTDAPEMPSDFHDLIVWRACEKYGRFKAAPEVLARGQTEGGILMRQLEQDQLPQLALGAPMA